jgi:flavin reductase (DIM6/NTAB) family NADH-FMN oxidoreductase RutF
MKKNLGDKIVFAPQPVLIIATYDENGNPNAMNAAWGGQISFHEIELNLSPHKTTENLNVKKALTVSFADKSHIKEADYFGLVSGHKVSDKIAKAGMHTVKSEHVDAPVIEEFPLTLECEVTDVTPLGRDVQVKARVVNVLADESILDENGKVDLDKLQPLVYDPSYRVYRVVAPGILGQCWNIGKEIAAAE